MLTVLFNGPPGVGKSTYCESFARQFGWMAVGGITYGFRRESFIQSIREMLVGMYARVKPVPYYEVDSDWDRVYAEAKEATIAGIPGRNWLFHMGDAIRAADPDAFPKDLITRVEKNLSQAVVLVDDLGFSNELNHLAAAWTPGLIITVYLSKRPGFASDYTTGDIFDGDIRECLKGYADLVDPSPDELADYIRERIEEQTRQR